MRVLTVNCGSSSLKFDVFDLEGRGVTRLARGMVDRIGGDAVCSVQAGDLLIERQKLVEDHAQAFEETASLLDEAGLMGGITGVGHRVVHGGNHLRAPIVIDEPVIKAIEDVSELAPLHNGPAVAAIRGARARMGETAMVATFDTAFYADLPEVAATYALPRDVRERFGIRRFGFHGLAHRYMTERFRALRPEVEHPRLITLQLGNGCSATASLDGKPLDTSMGFTPLEGLIMGTRSGDIDPSLPLFLARKAGLSLDEVESMLNSESGLLGLSGRSNDMRDLLAAEASGDAAAALAIEAFCYRVRKFVGSYLSVLGGADALIFGGGIGEHSGEVRRRICTGLAWAGLTLDEQANIADGNTERRVSAKGGALEAWVLPVDEATVIARDVVEVLSAGGSL